MSACDAIVYFLSENIIYCFDLGSCILSMVIRNGTQDNYFPVPGVPSPAPLEFKINCCQYTWFDFSGKPLLEVHDERTGTKAPVALFEDLSRARSEQDARLASTNSRAFWLSRHGDAHDTS